MDGDKFGVWLRAEEGAFSVLRKGSQLHRIENPRKDFFDLYSNEELRINKEDQVIDPGRIPSSDLNHNSSPTRDPAYFPISNSNKLPRGPDVHSGIVEDPGATPDVTEERSISL
ncbi:hypothetical protein FEM48_Zijuj11G0071900 [Ziziphus jujuba var. spinosa]|uniref:Uncharacterized protein n=1 Tax=Ziziphus jujuba var. spinosa TaxID=714518 RepID=A0A978UHJ9_ZIZJJ|nr:hypothetical protein FEM48_Zijuj11G0071900 [Ziziphus jujuba var. spinosa]